MNITEWYSRGLYRTNLQVWHGDDAIKKISVTYQKGQVNAVPAKEAGTSVFYNIWHAEAIKDVTIRMSKPDNAVARVAQIEVFHDGGEDWKSANPMVFGSAPTKLYGQEMKFTRPAPYDKHKWFFGGFYGTYRDVGIESLGVVWTREWWGPLQPQS